MELAIDTSTEIAGIALSESGSVIAELTWQSGRNHTVELLPGIDYILSLKKGGMNSIKAIFIARGPGSFNGLRVGISTAKGFAFALNIPLIAVNTLEIEAYPFALSNLPINAIHNAGRGEIAVASYIQKNGWQCIKEHYLTTPEQLISSINEKTLFCGEIPEAVLEQLKSELGELAEIPDKTARMRRPGYLTELAWKRLNNGQRDDISTLQPVYLRQPPITESKRKIIKK